MKGGQADKTRLLHIPDAIQEIKSYIKDLDFLLSKRIQRQNSLPLSK